MNIKSRWKSKIYFLLTLLFVYILLFEFILTENRILPKPSFLLDAFSSIWSDYQLLQAFTLTTSVIYTSLIVSYLIVILKSRFIIKAAYDFSGSVETLKVFSHVPALFLIFFSLFWFGNSIGLEFFLALVIVSWRMGYSLFEIAKNVKMEYVSVGKNLGLSENKIFSKIVWKASEPEVYKSLLKSHFYIWGFVLVYEFIAGINGFGGVLKTILNYNDFIGFIAVAILISLIIMIANYILELIGEKLVPWEQ